MVCKKIDGLSLSAVCRENFKEIRLTDKNTCTGPQSIAQFFLKHLKLIRLPCNQHFYKTLAQKIFIIFDDFKTDIAHFGIKAGPFGCFFSINHIGTINLGKISHFTGHPVRIQKHVGRDFFIVDSFPFVHVENRTSVHGNYISSGLGSSQIKPPDKRKYRILRTTGTQHHINSKRCRTPKHMHVFIGYFPRVIQERIIKIQRNQFNRKFFFRQFRHGINLYRKISSDAICLGKSNSHLKPLLIHKKIKNIQYQDSVVISVSGLISACYYDFLKVVVDGKKGLEFLFCFFFCRKRIG